MTVKIPIRKDSRPVRESVTESIGNKGLPTVTVGSPFMAIAIRSESAISTTKAIPSFTDHLPKRVFGIKSIFIYFHSTKKPPSWRFVEVGLQ